MKSGSGYHLVGNKGEGKGEKLEVARTEGADQPVEQAIHVVTDGLERAFTAEARYPSRTAISSWVSSSLSEP